VSLVGHVRQQGVVAVTMPNPTLLGRRILCVCPGKSPGDHA